MSNSWDGMRLRPDGAKESMEVETPQGMRARINEYSFRGNQPFVRAILDQARYRGLNGDDTMTWLAFEALCRAEQLEEMVLNAARTNPIPPIFLTPTAAPSGDKP